MTSATPWGAVPQVEGAIEATFHEAAEKIEDHAPKKIEDTPHISHQQPSSSSNPATDTSSELEKVASNPQIQHLARQITAHSIRTAEGNDYPNPFAEGKELDPNLDPRSGHFNPEAWVRTLIGLQSRDPERYPKRVAGVAYKHLNVHGFGSLADYQKTFGNYPLSLASLFNHITGRGKRKIQILRNFEGLVRSGEMLVVLGRPGSGCSTLLKTIAGETHGFYIDDKSHINYQGIPKETMHRDFRGECMYQAEVDVHFPQLTVGQTLIFAAEARAPRNRMPGVTRKQYAKHMTEVILAVFGLSHTFNTKVGNDFIRGVSGGERKRVSIAEAALGGSPLQCWDNSTRGLDSATALEFVKTLRISTSLAGSTAAVAIYQASQSIYDIFDKVVVLYEGRQIFFGDTTTAKDFFINMGFHCTERATTGDFLTSLTNPAERIVREGFENRVPRTPDEFAERWKQSEERARLLAEIDEFDKAYPLGGEQLQKFQHSRKAAQAKSQRAKSPYTISIPMQVKLCIVRGFQRLQGDASITLTGIFGNSMMALVIGSVFYNLPATTTSFYSRSVLLFFAILLNAFSSVLEILTLYAQRPIVEKHSQYAFYHPISEAIASMICDLPSKIGTSIFFNLTLYFMTNLRRTPSAFFTYYLFSFLCVLAMSMFFRSIAAMSRTLAQAMAPAAVLILALVIYTGFAVPIRDMHPWFRWINYIDPVAYAFESLMINEFHNRDFSCTNFVPTGSSYANVSPDERVCNTVGSRPGQDYVNGDAFINTSFSYYHSHLWRNLGILLAITVGLCALYLFATEFISAQRSKGEVLLFRRGMVPKIGKDGDEEKPGDDRPTAQDTIAGKTISGGDIPPSIQKQTAIFHWLGVNYDIKIKGGGRRILDDVDGWIKPGTLTALMGATGAGKTSLLDVLASRVTMGVVSGQMMVDGRQRDSGFQRKTGYVQQQDLHLATSTVREALNFSALLRQPKTTPRKEKLEYVDEVIKVLEMEGYADAVVGVPGEGLNVEQRKRLTIGVELAAKPALLLFLDEPTSGLDSQTAWSIVALLRKLANNGQAILCTIHQPSAVLFQEFDRLLFLVAGGKTVYFGDIGQKSTTLTSYFERNGSRQCGVEENPAEWMLDVVGAAPGSQNTIDWPQVWRDSDEKQQIRNTLMEMKQELSKLPVEDDSSALREFAEPFVLQLVTVTKRVFQQYWRTPSYLYSKTLLCSASALFIGFSFWDSAISIQGLQNQLFSIFLLMTIFGNLVQQIMPHFVTQRALYEARERPAKVYSWKVFMLSNIVVELPWNTLMAIIIFFCFYYPIGMYRNASPMHQTHERGALMFLLVWEFLIFTSTFTDMVIAGIGAAETAGNIANLLFSLTLVFCGVLASPEALPGFWIFMYRISPFTYLVDGMLSTGLANNVIRCSEIEFIYFNPRSPQNCADYMATYIDSSGGYLTNPNATSNCRFCSASDTNAYLKALSSNYTNRWRNFGIMWAFIIFNVFAALFFYWLARVPRKQTVKEEAMPDPALSKTTSRTQNALSKLQSRGAISRQQTKISADAVSEERGEKRES
ncbi:MAG: hypothetical protein Q9217_003814 [Psora testacea]